MIPVRTETMVDTIDIGEWLSIDLEKEPDDPDDPAATADFLVRIGDVQFKIRAPYLSEGAIEVLEATRISGEPRTKWPDLKGLRPQVVRMRRRRSQEDPAEVDSGTDDPEEPESA